MALARSQENLSDISCPSKANVRPSGPRYTRSRKVICVVEITERFGVTPSNVSRRTVAISVAGALDDRAVQRIGACLTNVAARRSAAFISFDEIIAVQWSALCRLCALVRALRPNIELHVRARQPRVRRLLETLSAA